MTDEQEFAAAESTDSDANANPNANGDANPNAEVDATADANPNVDPGADQFAVESAIDAIPDPWFAVDRRGRLREWNEAFAEATGYADAALDGMSAQGLVPEEERGTLRRVMSAVFEREEPDRRESLLLAASGERIPCEFASGPLTDDDGTVVGMTGTARRLERQPRLTDASPAQRHLEAIANDPRTIVALLDTEGRLRQANDAAVWFFGVDRESLRGRPLRDAPDRAFPARVRERLRNGIERAADGEFVRFELPCPYSDGEVVLDLVLRPVYGRDDRVESIIAEGIDITDRKRSQRELDRAQELLEQSHQIAGVGGWELDVSGDGIEMSWTEQVYRIYGLPVDEPLDVEAAIEFYHPEDRPRLCEAVERALEEGEPYDLELRLLTADDELRWIRTIGRPVRDDGEIVAVRGTIRDVTERKEREQALAASEARFRSLTEAMDTATVGTFILDDDYSVVWANELVEEYLGVDADAVVGRDKPELVESELKARFEKPERFASEVIGSYRDDTGIAEFECHVLAGDGREDRWLLHRSMPIEEGKYAGGRVEHYLDITDRKRRQRQLQAERDRFSALFENLGTPAVYYEFDEGRGDFVGRMVNPAFEETFGYDADEVVGEELTDLLIPEDRAAESARTDEKLLDGERVEAETTRLTADGPREFWFRAVPMQVGNACTSGYALYTDITDRKRRQRQLQAERDRFSALFENLGTPAVYYEFDEESERCAARKVNPAFEETFGVDADAIEGEPLNDFILPAGKADESAELGRRTMDGKRVEAEITRLTADGPREFRLRSVPVGREGSSRGYALYTDITDRKRRQRELERTRELLEQSQRIAGVGGWELTVTEDGEHELTCTDELYRMHELPVGEPIDIERAFDLVHPEDRPRLREAVERALEDGEPYNMEIRTITAEGNLRWIQTNGRPITAAEGGRDGRDGDEVVAIRGSLADITERKKNERQLQAERDHFSALFENDTTAIVAYEFDDERILFRDINPAFEETFGFEADAVVGESIDEVIVPDEHEREGRRLNDSLRAGERIETEVTRLTVDGPREFWLRSVPMGVEDSTASGYLLYTDITERNERKRQLETQRDELATLNEINALIQDIIQALTDAATREEIEEIVCEWLGQSRFYGGAWIAERAASGDRLVSRASCGGDERLHEQLAESDVALRTGQVRVFTDIRDDPAIPESIREQFLAHGYTSAIDVPLVYRSTVYGVLQVHAEEPAAFSDRVRSAFGVLGEVVGFAIDAAQNRKLLHANRLLELEFRLPESETFLTDLSEQFGCVCEVEGLVPNLDDGGYDSGTTLYYVSVAGADPEEVRELAADHPVVERLRTLGDGNDATVYEIEMSPASGLFFESGIKLASATVADGEGTVVLHAASDTDVRALSDALAQNFGTVDLAAKREVEHPVRTDQEIREHIDGLLTERQSTALRTAYYGGYFDWPRNSTAEEVADALGIASPTLHQHLRKAQRKLLAAVLDDMSLDS